MRSVRPGDYLLISIHSLVKRETLFYDAKSDTAGYFNPLPRKEGDLTRKTAARRQTHFNPLPRKEGD